MNAPYAGEWAGAARPLDEVLRARVEDGVDCTADESSKIKAHFDTEDLLAPDTLAGRLAAAFPNEGDEWQSDAADGLRALGVGWLL